MLFVCQDLPPIADAGNDVVIQFPTDTVTLNGKKSSDDVAIVKYQWDLLSGDDSSFTIADDDTAEPTVSGLEGGTYTLKLTVFDIEGQSDDDTVDVTVTGQYLNAICLRLV